MANIKAQAKKLSRINTLHCLKLIFRALLFLAVGLIYLVNRLSLPYEAYLGGEWGRGFVRLLWLTFIVEMLTRFFPSRFESMGCQKQFRKNFSAVHCSPALTGEIKKQHRRSVLLIGGFWLALNGGVGALYFAGVIDRDILLILALAFSVCDMICILFFCPFQTWVMKNKCCVNCRIYNWDYAMMFTPLIFVGGFYAWSLVGCAVALLLKWEYVYYRHPERFTYATNGLLSCAYCKERLCRHKRSLRRLWEKRPVPGAARRHGGEAFF